MHLNIFAVTPRGRDGTQNIQAFTKNVHALGVDTSMFTCIHNSIMNEFLTTRSEGIFTATRSSGFGRGYLVVDGADIAPLLGETCAATFAIFVHNSL